MDETKKLTVKDVMAARHSSNFHDVLLAYLEQMEMTHPLVTVRPPKTWLDAPYNPGTIPEVLLAEPVAYPSITAVAQAVQGTNFREILVDYLAYLDHEIIEIYSALAKLESLPSAPLHSIPGEVLKNE